MENLLFSPLQEVLGKETTLFPYLFILCMEYLSIFIEEEVQHKKWKPLRISKSGPSLTHSLFDDDIVLFGNRYLSSIQSVKKVLNSFCGKSCHTINLSKSKFCVSKNMDESTSSLIHSTLGI